MLTVYLRDRQPTMVSNWEKVFEGIENVYISQGDIFEGFGMKVDAVVSPANSFGFMDGGIDYIYSLKFGWEMSEALRKIINKEYYGELPVGQAVVVDIRKTNPKTNIPFLISAPTMRVPLDVSQTANAYLAFRAALRVAEDHPEIESILCPGLGTAVGQMPHYRCARQMWSAWNHHNRKPEDIGYAELEQPFTLHHLMIS